jgi:hypothetical protein
VTYLPVHVIQIEYDADNDRSYWECGCGVGGSCADSDAARYAERHIPEGERVAYRSSPRGACMTDLARRADPESKKAKP